MQRMRGVRGTHATSTPHLTVGEQLCPKFRVRHVGAARPDEAGRGEQRGSPPESASDPDARQLIGAPISEFPGHSGDSEREKHTY